MDNQENYLAHIKFEGDLVKDGYLDARKSADVLVGIDEIFRYFLHKKSPKLSGLEFDLPVRIRKGSWETIIPENIGEWLELVVGSGVTTYTVSALKKMAQNDIGDSGFKDVFKSIIKGVKWIINIGKHLKTLKKKTFDKVELKEIDGVQFLGILNEDGKTLFVPQKYLELYAQVPETIFSRIAKIIEEDRALKIGFSPSENKDIDDTKEDATINNNEKSIFYQSKEEDDILFPELKHNQYVELQGHITRGNENSNTIGFEYQKHILTCYPINGRIVDDRSHFFGDCIIRGYVNRMDKTGAYIEKRPQIAYMDIIPTESNKDPELF